MTAGKPWVPDRGDVIGIQFNPRAGDIEMKDEHPLLVLTTKAFNERTGLVIGLPMTHSERNETNPFAVKYLGPRNEVAYILTHQPKSFDWRERAARPHPWKALPKTAFDDVCEELNSILQIG